MRDNVQSVFSDASNLPVETVADEDYEEAVDLAGEMHRHLQDGDWDEIQVPLLTWLGG